MVLSNICAVSNTRLGPRILAHLHHPDIRDEDIVVTADVDAFIMTPAILKPLQKKTVKVGSDNTALEW